MLLSLATAPSESGAYLWWMTGTGFAATWLSKGGSARAHASCNNDNMAKVYTNAVEPAKQEKRRMGSRDNVGDIARVLIAQLKLPAHQPSQDSPPHQSAADDPGTRQSLCRHEEAEARQLAPLWIVET
ncbi:hypothetical protein KCU88_g2373, partial [Aureobasidium melanogenum]